MQRHWSAQELEAYWLFSQTSYNSSRTEMQAVALGRFRTAVFPARRILSFFRRDIPSAAIDYMAKQLDVEPTAISDYDWQGRTGKRGPGATENRTGCTPRDCRRLQSRGDMALVRTSCLGITIYGIFRTPCLSGIAVDVSSRLRRVGLSASYVPQFVRTRPRSSMALRPN